MKPEKPPTPPSIPPEKMKELEDAERERAEACARSEAAAKKHEQTAQGLKRTISDPKLRAVRLPTPSQIELDPKLLPK